VGTALAEAFPGTRDIFDLLFPPTSFGDWLRNLRLRRGFQQRELAKLFNVHEVTVCRYEKNVTVPEPKVLRRLKEEVQAQWRNRSLVLIRGPIRVSEREKGIPNVFQALRPQ